jgi:hypothetical protein
VIAPLTYVVQLEQLDDDLATFRHRTVGEASTFSDRGNRVTVDLDRGDWLDLGRPVTLHVTLTEPEQPTL